MSIFDFLQLKIDSLEAGFKIKRDVGGSLGKKFGKRLRQVREKRGFSVEQLAGRVGVSTQSLSSWQSGKTWPSAKHLEIICEVLEVPPAVFFDFDGERAKKLDELMQRLVQLEDEAQALRAEIRLLVGE